MTIVTKKDRIGASRAKLALVGVLTVVLVVVIVGQLPESVDPGEGSAASVTDMPGWAEGQVQQVVATPVANPVAAPTQPLAEKPAREWPELTIEEVVAHDPLAPTPWYLTALGKDESDEANGTDAKPTEDPADALILAELQKEGAKIVLIADGQRVATVGDRQLRIGDKIEGYQVTDITDEGVILTKSRNR